MTASVGEQHSVADLSEDRTSEIDEHEDFLDSQEEWDQLFDHFQSFVVSIARGPEERHSGPVAVGVEKRSMSVSTVLANLSKLVQSIAPLDGGFITEVTHFYALSSGVGAYLRSVLERDALEALSAQLDSAVSRGLQGLCRLPLDDAHSVLSPDLATSRVQALQAAVRARSGAQGVAALERPVVYVREDRAQLAVAACVEVGLPPSAVCLVPRDAAPGKGVSISAFSNVLALHQSEGLSPLAIFACVDVAYIDDVRQLSALASQYGAWLHVEGDTIPLQACMPVPECVLPILDGANSATGRPGAWFRLPDDTVWTYFRDAPAVPIRRTLPLFASLPLYFYMQRTGLIGLAAPFVHALALADGLYHRLSKVPNVVVHPMDGPVVRFRFVPSTAAQDAGDSAEQLALLNRLTEQIRLDLMHAIEAPIDLQLWRHTIGTDPASYHSYIVFTPLHVSSVMDLSDAIMETLAEDLRFETSLIDSTLCGRAEFAAVVKQHAGLRNVAVDNFVGLGSVRYVPVYVDEGKAAQGVAKELEALNEAIATQLATQDPGLFSHGVDSTGLNCTCLGVDTNAISTESIQRHVQTIMDAASEAERKSNILEKVSEIIRMGISSAQAELEQENRQQLYQEGVIRQLPIVGGWYNWVMPAQKAQVKGRQFDLTRQELKPSPLKDSPRRSPSADASATNDASPKQQGDWSANDSQ
eukprot:TRINITY_DN4823_c1_g1_i1.p1 TRINITY_DN4823_c1_g1~~TRINITY_DN4823_c1_g1_i1.p1  ORF type:complete len:699 (-),score=210.21 TRINITY_DN4823_c1_g1_i1:414-2510(-)